MRVPVLDARGIELDPCPPARARRLVRNGKAVPHHDRQGRFCIQLTYERPEDQAVHLRHSPDARQVSRRLRRALHRAQLQAALDALAEQPKACNLAKKLDRLIVIDIEATCWEHEPPPDQYAEIIEIGICSVNVASGERLAKESILVRPEHSQVSTFCTELTTLTQEQVEQGISFEAACQALREKYDTKHRVWASYGDYDRRLFEKQCQDHGIPYPFGPTHVNVKSLLALVFGLQREVGMMRALELLELPAEGTHHRGVDDAWNTGLIAARLLLNRRAELKEPTP